MVLLCQRLEGQFCRPSREFMATMTIHSSKYYLSVCQVPSLCAHFTSAHTRRPYPTLPFIPFRSFMGLDGHRPIALYIMLCLTTSSASAARTLPTVAVAFAQNAIETGHHESPALPI